MVVFALTLSLALAVPHARCAGPAGEASPAGSVGRDSTLVALYEAGQPWREFLDAARARRAMWLENAARPLAPADAVARARALPGRWRLLVVAVDSCSDSVNTVPFLAQLVAQVPQLEMRVISPAQGRALMEARRTPDGRAATPTVIVLDADGAEAGCWIERPSALQAIALQAGAGGGTPGFAERKAAWYAEDGGASTVAEVVALLERAAAGARGCDAAAARTGQ
jgi:hypothetical protein